MAHEINGWQLALVRHSEVKSGFSAKSIGEITSAGKTIIPASVPGNFELDMHAAGLIDDPYYADNIIELQKLEDMHLWYFTTFDFEHIDGQDTFIEFGGIDTVAEIYLDGELFAKTENMLIPHTFALDAVPAGRHELVVHILPSCICARDYRISSSSFAMGYNSDSLVLRKAAYMYGWDIMPRAVSGGLWKPVRIIHKPKTRIEEFYLSTRAISTAEKTAGLSLSLRLHTDRDLIYDLHYGIEGRCGDSAFSYDYHPFSTYNTNLFIVNNAKLWMPKNYGEPNLYDVTITLFAGDTALDSKSFKYGIKIVELERTSLAGEDGEFVFRVNGKKIFCLGTNWVPLDAFPSRFAELQPRALAMLDDIGCNMVRCWGGSLYPDEDFYDFCDAHGILVWQDFGMGCAHYPDDERFCRLLEEEALYIVQSFRNHASLALWSGDNECDSFVYGQLTTTVDGRTVRCVDPNDNLPTRTVLKRVIRNNDYAHPYLPSSPYYDTLAFTSGKSTSEDHLWGPRDFFKGNYYGTAISHFASEIGYHGCPSPETLRKFIPEEHIHAYGDCDICNDRMWLTHAAAMVPEYGNSYTYRIPLMTKQVNRLFDEVPDDIQKYALESQISQAEAKKFFIERFRIAKWHKTGILWWNLIDGWPQISDAIVDWYGTKKLAYSYIARSQQPFCLMFDEPKDGRLTLVAANDTRDTVSVHYTVRELSTGRTVLTGDCSVPSDTSAPIAEIPETHGGFYLIEWDGGAAGKNHFTASIADCLNLEEYVSYMKESGFWSALEGFDL